MEHEGGEASRAGLESSVNFSDLTWMAVGRAEERNVASGSSLSTLGRVKGKHTTQVSDFFLGHPKYLCALLITQILFIYPKSVKKAL